MAPTPTQKRNLTMPHDSHNLETVWSRTYMYVNMIFSSGLRNIARQSQQQLSS